MLFRAPLSLQGEGGWGVRSAQEVPVRLLRSGMFFATRHGNTSETGGALSRTGMKIDTGDTAWLLVSTALVLFMTPGLALFYGGMVRRKNVLATLMHSFSALPLVTLQWVLVGYTLSFGPTR